MNLASVVLFLVGLLASRLGLSGPILQVINAVVAWAIGQIPQDKIEEWGKAIVTELVRYLLSQGIPPSQIPEEINQSPWFPNPLPQVGPAPEAPGP